MVGNDVVDLWDPDTDPDKPRARFDARVCREHERAAIAGARDVSRERWCHWAAKEAAYKLARQRDASVIFSPVRFEVELEAVPASWDDAALPRTPRFGRVRHPALDARLRIDFEDGSVHALATPQGGARGRLWVGRQRLAEDDARAADPAGHSAAVRALATAALAAPLGVSPERLSIVKDQRIPKLRVDGESVAADLTLSHHGRVVAFACMLSSHSSLERLAS